jgi:hypothetical protein
MTDRREPSHPPSDPHPALVRPGGLFAVEDRPVRLQLVGALLFGLVLVASGLYVWRRPRAAEPAAEAAAASAAAVASQAAVVAAISPPAAGDAGGASSPTLSAARVLGCHDRGSHKTPPDQCDHLASVEEALSSAITQASSCVPASGGGGTIEYVADVSFLRQKVSLSLPRGGRSVRDAKVLRACSTAVRGGIQGLSLGTMDHAHARYKIAVTATYRGASGGG